MLRLLRSESRDPYENLALEEELFDALGDDERILLLWVDDPCVVVGRFQNPWLECRVDELREAGIPIVRRRSGGGTVFHDEGNLCFSFLAHREAIDRKDNSELVAGALRSLGVPAEATERFDIRAGGAKLSGSALRESRGKRCHHGTLLVSSGLGELRRFLSPRDLGIRSRGTPSVPSGVANVKDFVPGLDIDAVAAAVEEAVVAAYSAEGSSGPSAPDHRSDGRQAERKIALAAWDWIYGASPDFEQKIPLTRRGPEDGEEQVLHLSVSGGRVGSAALVIRGGAAIPLGVPEGTRYDRNELAAALERQAGEEHGEIAMLSRRAAEAIVAGLLGC